MTNRYDAICYECKEPLPAGQGIVTRDDLGRTEVYCKWCKDQSKMTDQERKNWIEASEHIDQVVERTNRDVDAEGQRARAEAGQNPLPDGWIPTAEQRQAIYMIVSSLRYSEEQYYLYESTARGGHEDRLFPYIEALDQEFKRLHKDNVIYGRRLRSRMLRDRKALGKSLAKAMKGTIPGTVSEWYRQVRELKPLNWVRLSWWDYKNNKISLI